MMIFDRGGGGGAGGPRAAMYAVEDYVRILESFQEIPGEHPVVAVARKSKWLADGLARLGRERNARQREETAMAAGVLVGAHIANHAAMERERATEAARDSEIAAHSDRFVHALEEIGRLESKLANAERNAKSSTGAGVALAVLGLGAVFALARAVRK